MQSDKLHSYSFTASKQQCTPVKESFIYCRPKNWVSRGSNKTLKKFFHLVFFKQKQLPWSVYFELYGNETWNFSVTFPSKKKRNEDITPQSKRAKGGW